MNAINVKEGQAKVREESCILCGKCVSECPQQAKLITNESHKVIDYLSSNRKVVLSLAPSFPGFFYGEQYDNLWTMLRILGFYGIEETSLGALYTKEAYNRLFNNSNQVTISSCCPVVVNLIEIYFPELLGNLAPVASPAIAHGLSIKERLGWDVKVVFASPCIAKMSERGKEGKIDAIITFEQLKGLINDSTISNSQAEKLREKWGHMETRLFPLHGGGIRSFMADNLTNTQADTVSGLDDCWQALEAIRNSKLKIRFIELLGCRGGCIGGPLMDKNTSLLERRQNVVKHYLRFKSLSEIPLKELSESLLKREFKERSSTTQEASNEQLNQILAQIGIFTAEDERNCGGCGYNTCKEKAQAVYNGHAEVEMCMSYMKKKAESTAHTIVNSTPNGIIVFDHNLRLKEFNPAAVKMFEDYSLELGKYLGSFMETSHIEKVIAEGVAIMDIVVYFPEIDLYTRQIVVPILDSNHLYMAIITDVTEDIKKKKELEQIKTEILTKANQVINNQMLVAQQIAGLLGETTAETKTTLLELKKHFSRETEREK